MTKRQQIAALRRILELAGQIQDQHSEAESPELYYLLGGVFVNAEDAIGEIEAQMRPDPRAWEANFIAAMTSGNITINGKRVR